MSFDALIQVLIYHHFKNMRKFLLFILAYYLLVQTSSQQIVIKPSITFAPEIANEYNIVQTVLYPPSKIVASALPKDFYVKKLKESNISKVVEKEAELVEKGPLLPALSFENSNKEILIMPTQRNPTPIQDYHAVQVVYPLAKIQQQPQPAPPPKPIEIVFKSPAEPQKQNYEDQPYKKVDNSNQDIQWKVKDLPPLRDYVIQNEDEFPLSKSLITSQLGTAQLATEGPADIKKPIIPSRTETPPPTPQKQSLLYNSQAKAPQTPTPIKSTPPQTQTQKPSNKQILEQIQKLKYKSHKWSIIIVIAILAILFLVYLLMKCWGRRDVDFWEDLNKKLDNYRNPSEVVLDEEEQVMTNRSNQLIQNELE